MLCPALAEVPTDYAISDSSENTDFEDIDEADSAEGATSYDSRSRGVLVTRRFISTGDTFNPEAASCAADGTFNPSTAAYATGGTFNP